HRRDQAGNPETVAAHGDADRLAFRTQGVEAEDVGEPPAEGEDVRDLDTAAQFEGAVHALRAGVAGEDGGGFDGAVRGEVTTADHVDRVPAGLVGAGDPGGPRYDPGVDQIAELAGQFLRADVPADQVGTGVEVLDHGD